MRPEEGGLVLDAGAFIALEGRDRRVTRLLDEAFRAGVPLETSAAVVSQIWRGGAGTQAPVAALLARTKVVALDDGVARVLGRMLARAGTSDPIDAHVVLLAIAHDWPVLTSDPEDLLAIDPNVVVERV